MQKQTMYSKRKSFSKSLRFDKAFLESFKNALEAGGFNSVSFKLPMNLLKEAESDEISYEDFLKRERNYPSCILLAYNSTTKETLKVLFVNISTKTFFKDNTFPSGHSEPPEMYIQSSPDRLEPLFNFYYGRFFADQNGLNTAGQALGGLLSLFTIVYYLAVWLMQKEGIFTSLYDAPLLDYITLAIAIIIFFAFVNHQTGLYVKPKEFRPSVWIKMALKGELRDNPLLNLIIGVVGGLIVLLIGKLLGW